MCGFVIELNEGVARCKGMLLVGGGKCWGFSVREAERMFPVPAVREGFHWCAVQ